MRFLRVGFRVGAAAEAEVARFYGDRLGLPEAAAAAGGVAFRADGTVLEFSADARGRPFYHFALRVPRNRFAAARAWLAREAELLPPAGGATPTFEFESWNAVACYAHDPAGNIVELIAHRELPEETPGDRPFRADELLGVCEVGLVSPETGPLARTLEPLGIRLWDGSLEPGRLAFLGGRDGTLILAPAGRGWVPTGRPAEVHPVDVLAAGGHDAAVAPPGTPHVVRTRRVQA